jgi:hypothetical protein
MISRIWNWLRKHHEHNVLRQDWNRLRLESKGTNAEESTLDSINSSYIFGITTSTALFMIFLGYILYLIIFPGSADYQYKTLFSDLIDTTSDIDPSNKGQTGFSLGQILQNSVSILIAVSIFAVALLLAIFSKIEYQNIQLPLMLRLFRERYYCLYCGKKSDEINYQKHIEHHQEFFKELGSIDDPNINDIRSLFKSEKESKKKLLEEAEIILKEVINQNPKAERSRMDDHIEKEMKILKRRVNEGEKMFNGYVDKAKEKLKTIDDAQK